LFRASAEERQQAMITREQEVEILRLHFAEGWPVGTIST
jgi:hypothetical protein